MVREVQVRPATSTDLPALHAASIAIFGTEAHSYTVWRQFLDLSHPLVLIATDQTECMGYAVIAPTWRPGEAWFLNLGVLPKFQTRGIGRRLAREAISMAQKLYIENIYLTVEPGNTPAISLYSKLGFIQTKTEDDYYHNGESRLIMRLDTQTFD
jgi:ribosomal-protein-alanine N-acetyltransferase